MARPMTRRFLADLDVAMTLQMVDRLKIHGVALYRG
jgi:hypothetical protein